MCRYSNSQTGSMTALIVPHASEQARRRAKTILTVYRRGRRAGPFMTELIRLYLFDLAIVGSLLLIEAGLSI